MSAAQEGYGTAAVNGLHRPNRGKYWQTQKCDGAGLMDTRLQFPVVHRLCMWVK